MKFVKSLFRFDPAASFMEKAVTVFVPLLAGSLLIWLIVASYGVGHSALAHSAQLARPNARIWGTLILLAAAFWAWWNWTDRIPFRVNDIVATIVLLLLIVLAINANTGFFAATY